MHDDDPETVKRMLSYLYTLDYVDEHLPDDPTETVVAEAKLPPHLRHKTKTATGGENRSGGSFSGVESEPLYDPKRLNNVLVYAIADKYDVPELKELAKRKFQHLMNNEWSNFEFEAVRNAIFGTTPSQDTSLRQILSQICINHVEDIVKDVRLRSVVLSNEELAHELLEHAMQEKADNLRSLYQALDKQVSMQDALSEAKSTIRFLDQNKQKENELQDKLAKAKAETQTVRLTLDQSKHKETVLQEKLTNARAETQMAMNQRNNLLSKFNAVVSNANKLEECRNCGDDFGSWIECLGNSDDPQFQLRCSNCRCRHAL